MRVFIFGLTLIISAFVYLGFSSGDTDVEVEELNQLPVAKKAELFDAFEQIAVKREVASKDSYSRVNNPEPVDSEEVPDDSEFDAYLEERRESISIAKGYLAERGADHTDTERRELEEMVAELETAVDIIKIHMVRTDSERAYDLEDRFDEVLDKFESMMKE